MNAANVESHIIEQGWISDGVPVPFDDILLLLSYDRTFYIFSGLRQTQFL